MVQFRLMPAGIFDDLVLDASPLTNLLSSVPAHVRGGSVDRVWGDDPGGRA